MKTIKRIFVAIAFMSAMAGYANDTKVINGEDATISIVEENKTVQVSILNTQNTSYTLTIYSDTGDLVFEGTLGNDMSLGKVFDFANAEQGNYKFKFVSSNGETHLYTIETGSKF
ncbi:MAG: hypothetical protein KTR22_08870 [Flavobacteriaceae bacterium]|nr:hypothetical protein [Flavobacteriaceae bacterium]